MMPKCSARNRSRPLPRNASSLCPRISKLPDCANTMPVSRLSSVDFPLPEGPSSRSRSPRGIWKAPIDKANESRTFHWNSMPRTFTASVNERFPTLSFHIAKIAGYGEGGLTISIDERHVEFPCIAEPIKKAEVYRLYLLSIHAGESVSGPELTVVIVFVMGLFNALNVRCAVIVRVFFCDEFDVDGGDSATCCVGQLEKLQGLPEVGERSRDSSLLAGGISFVLETDRSGERR